MTTANPVNQRGWAANAAVKEAGRAVTQQRLTRLLRSTGQAISLAVGLALPLAGCIKSHGPLLPPADASSPLPAGQYFSVSNLNATPDLPAIHGPVRVRIRGNTYIATPAEPGEKPLRFQLIKLANTRDVFILQTEAEDKSGYRDILIGVVGENGFCSKDIRNFPPEAVTDREIVSAPTLLRWLTDKASEIPSMTNDVCFIRTT